jgi:hypothetical protein
MPEPEPMMCYAWSFDGAPRAGSPMRDGAWFEIPGSPRLAATRATVALKRARTAEVAVYRCAVTLEDGQPCCSDAMQLAEVDASYALRYFAAYCARTVLGFWQPEDVVRYYLRTGDAALRATAHQSAWASSTQLTGPARLAARVAMFAAHADQVALATREAARIQRSLRGADSLEATSLVLYHQERVLSAALMLAIDDPSSLKTAA